jgi:hypothetical protein
MDGFRAEKRDYSASAIADPPLGWTEPLEAV